jgi:hypothetical protein
LLYLGTENKGRSKLTEVRSYWFVSYSDWRKIAAFHSDPLTWYSQLRLQKKKYMWKNFRTTTRKKPDLNQETAPFMRTYSFAYCPVSVCEAHLCTSNYVTDHHVS